MNNINEIFFDNHGLTSTSASHLADLAQEVIAKVEKHDFFDYES